MSRDGLTPAQLARGGERDGEGDHVRARQAVHQPVGVAQGVAAEVHRLVAGAGVVAEVSLVPASFEETFVVLAA